MRFTTLSVLSTISTFFLARAAPVGEHSALPPLPKETNASADVFEEIQLPPRGAEDIQLDARYEGVGLRQPDPSGCVVA
ncbi:hypothetical protein C8R46DRAFT_1088596 [Mycena filopes]|nr:hypothetical protein C8R46DRAFT_1088596 [Mycena filopes]